MSAASTLSFRHDHVLVCGTRALRPITALCPAVLSGQRTNSNVVAPITWREIGVVDDLRVDTNELSVGWCEDHAEVWVNLGDGQVRWFQSADDRPETGYYADRADLARFCETRGLPLVETNGVMSTEAL